MHGWTLAQMHLSIKECVLRSRYTGVLPCIKQQMSLIADVQTAVLSLEWLLVQEEGHPADRKHVFGLPLSLSLHLNLVYL